MTCGHCEKAQGSDSQLVMPLRVGEGNLLVVGCREHLGRLCEAYRHGLRAEQTLHRVQEQTEIWAASIKRVVFTNQLAVLLGGSDTSFTGRLLELCAHADPGNLARLRALYPDVVLAWKAWSTWPGEEAPTPAELWARISELVETEL